MAWHIFERLLEEVANQSNHFIGKIWITALFMFRLITVASIGDTIYHDEQSAFKCNTQQPGCENVCFNHFSPISQIRFYAFQILLVGTPSIVYIIYAVHKRNKIPPTCYKEADTDESDYQENKKQNDRAENGKASKHETHEIKINSLPDYDDVIISDDGKISSLRSQKYSVNNKTDQIQSSGYYNDIERKPYVREVSGTELSMRKVTKDKSLKTGLKRKMIYKHDVKSEIVTTPAIRRAYFGQVLIRTGVEAFFLYMQFVLYKFDVKELYLCDGYPCPRVVECFVSRPMEKTIFLLFMYAMSALSLMLNVVEMFYLISKGLKGFFNPSSEQNKLSSESLPKLNYPAFKRHKNVEWRKSEVPRGFPKLGPHPRTHSNSFGNHSDNGTIDSEYYFYDG